MKNSFSLICFISKLLGASNGLSASIRRRIDEGLILSIGRGSTTQNVRVIKRLFTNLRFDSAFSVVDFVDLFVIDRLGGERITEVNRFSVVYVFGVPKHYSGVNQLSSRFQIEIIQSTNSVLPSVSSLWNGAEWAEREAWDMSGVRFSDHPDLRRLLTDYGFRGFPMRKEFPVFGFKQVRYDEGTESVVYEQLKLAQQEREFQVVNPWHYSWGPCNKLPNVTAQPGWLLLSYIAEKKNGRV